MQVVPFEFEKHYETCKNWWEARGWHPPYPKVLPPTGKVVLTSGNNPICAGWIYHTDSACMYMEWVIADPQSGKDTRNQALDLLINSLCSYAKPENILFTFSDFPAFISRLEEHGFRMGDKSTSILVKGGNELCQ